VSKKLLIPIVSVAFIVIAVLILLFRDNSTPAKSVTIEKILNESGQKQCYIEDGNLFVIDKNSVYKISIDAIDLKDVSKKCELTTKSPPPIDLFVLLLAIFFSAFSLFWFSKKLQRNNIDVAKQSQPSEQILPISSNTTFEDIAGIEEAKEELLELVDYLKNPAKYAQMGIRMPRGVLLVGPPGVGKTLLAKALANKAGVPFYYKSAATFVEMYVGVGARRVSDLFSAANKNAPAIVFIDEIDAIGRKRSGERNEEREATLNQLLTEMDGFESSSGILAIAATNKPDVLDEALLRANRFDRKVFVDLPDLAGRAELFKLYLRGKKHSANLSSLARTSVGFSGAMISSMVNEAALDALKKAQKEITDENFSAVASKVIDGKKRALVLDESQRKLLAYGQAAKYVLAHDYSVAIEHLSLSECRILPKNEDFMSEAEFLDYCAFFLSPSIALEMTFESKYALFWQDEKKALHSAELAKSKYMLFENQSVEDIINLARQKVKSTLKAKHSELDKFAKKLLEEQRV
jgi:ATP-dependent metalloprotease FtsH